MRRLGLFAMGVTWLATAGCGNDDAAPPPGKPAAGSAGTSATSGKGGDAGDSERAGRAGQSGRAGATGNAGEGAGGSAGGSEAGGTAGTGTGGSSGTAGRAAAGAGGVSGSASGSAGSDAGMAGDQGPDCELEVAVPAAPTLAVSSGYSGTDDAYFTLYDVLCDDVPDCANACTAIGGTTESCTSGSECPSASGSDRTCLPPTYWRNTMGALAPATDATYAAVMTMVKIAYHDALVVSGFGLSIPEGATLRGIGFTVTHASEAALVKDESMRLVTAAGVVGSNRSREETWGPTFDEVSYGGESDLWDANLSIADIESPAFGLAITPVYLDEAGNDRAYVAGITAYAYYTLCE